jgi:indolepyruvate ferredoxin oxidoreductase
VLDQTGLAQKGGAVTTHIRIAQGSPSDIHAVRIAAGEADLVLGCDMVVVNDYWALSKIRASVPTWCSTPTRRCRAPSPRARTCSSRPPTSSAVNRAGRANRNWSMPPRLATALLGDAIAANLFMLGYAWQQGWCRSAWMRLVRAIEFNGAAIEMNKTAFAWGRMAVVTPWPP